MRFVSIFLLAFVCHTSSAGSLGKYQQERVDVPITIAPVGKSPQTSSVPQPRFPSRNRANEAKRNFYNTFHQRVQQLSAEDKKIWLQRFKESLQVALGDSPIDVGKINHYSRLVSILLSQPEE
ncbi:MAG: hypothetical protein KTR18_06420 [Acidiferrobacterales bacterium]|nr:hypothetical protein [Acidiferrobacterales bacterium]